MAAGEEQQIKIDPAAFDIAVDRVHDEPDSPCAGLVYFAGPPGMDVGVWEHTAGISTDIEEDEVFVVVSGSATVEVEGRGAFTFGPGDVGVLREGMRTRWVVHETLRKVYVARGGINDKDVR